MKRYNEPIHFGLGGILLILAFLLLPMAPIVDAWNDAQPASILFSVVLEPNAERAGLFAALLVLPILVVLAVWLSAFWWALGALAGLYLTVLFMGVRPIYLSRTYPYGTGVPPFWSPYIGPGLLHWLLLSVGLGLMSVAVIQGLRSAPVNRRGPIELRGPAKKPSQAVPPSSVRRSQRQGISLGDVVASIDWGWWGILLLSLVAWPLGLLLHFAFSRSGDDKGDAALIGAGLGLGLMVLRFVLAMAKVGAAS